MLKFITKNQQYIDRDHIKRRRYKHEKNEVVTFYKVGIVLVVDR